MMIQIKYGYETEWLDQIMKLHNQTVMKRDDSAQVERTIKNSFAFASAWSDSELVGFGRMISDGERNSMIFDVIVSESCRKLGIGKKIMGALQAKAPGTRFYLTSTFGNEPFYEKLGFKKHKTAYALYPDASPYLVDEKPHQN